MTLNFPCDVGEKIYIVLGDDILEYTVTDFVYDGNFIWCHAANPAYCVEHRNIYRCISFDLGKTIFTSRTDAEKETKQSSNLNSFRKLPF